MFILSVKLTRKKMFLGVLAVALAVSTGVLWSTVRHGDDTVPATNPSASDGKTKSDENAEKKASKKVDKKKIAAKTNEQRLEFIRSFGWEVNEEPVEVLEVVIPKEFDGVYNEYNSMQKIQGFDLSSHSGKRCKRYSYELLNYPEKPEGVRINVLVRDNKVIGGDVCSMEPNGFMHGFAA